MTPHEARAIEIQISARVRRPKGQALTGQVLRDAIRYRIEEGENPPGIRLRIVSWSTGRHSNTSAGFSQAGLWERFTPLLRARLVDPEPIRARGRHSKTELTTV